MDREAARIRGLVRAAGPRGRGARFPDDVRRELIAFARSRRHDGIGVRRIAAATGVSTESIRRWTQRKESRSAARELVPVEVRADVPRSDLRRVALSVSSPTGYRIDGLTFEQAVVALGRLG